MPASGSESVATTVVHDGAIRGIYYRLSRTTSYDRRSMLPVRGDVHETRDESPSPVLSPYRREPMQSSSELLERTERTTGYTRSSTERRPWRHWIRSCGTSGSSVVITSARLRSVGPTTTTTIRARSGHDHNEAGRWISRWVQCRIGTLSRSSPMSTIGGQAPISLSRSSTLGVGNCRGSSPGVKKIVRQDTMGCCS
jgi:hypothetical protein